MLKRIYIHNYRSFVNFEWRPPAACVLVGLNGAGKSALFEVLRVVQDLVVHGKRLEELDFPSTLTVWRGDVEQTIELDLETDGELYCYKLVCRKGSGAPTISEELTADGEPLYRSGPEGIELFGDSLETPSSRTKIPFSPRASFLASLEARPASQRIVRFRDYVEAIWSLKPDPLRLGAEATAEAPWLERDLSNFASWYRTRVQEDPDAVESLRQDLRRVLEGFDQIRLRSKPGGTRDLVVRFRFEAQSYELGWGELSEGQRLLIALYGVYRLAVPSARLVVLDEIENYVAPSEIQPWLREVADAVAATNGQLFVISHHPESINYLAADSMWRMWRDTAAGHTRIAPLEADREAGELAYDAVKAEAANAG
jgi:predicted ATPase